MVIVCLRTVRIPADQRQRFLEWIDDNADLRRRHGILSELVLARSARQNPAGTLQPDTYSDPLEHVVITAWPDHDALDAWIDTPDRDRLTASATHEAVQFRPITRFAVIGGYLAEEIATTDLTGAEQ